MAQRNHHQRRRESSPYEHRGSHTSDRSRYAAGFRESGDYSARYNDDEDERRYGHRNSGGQPYGDQWRRHGHYQDSHAGPRYNQQWQDQDDEGRYDEDRGYESYRRQGPDYSYRQGPYYGQDPDFYGYDQRNRAHGGYPDGGRSGYGYRETPYRPQERNYREHNYRDHDRNWWDRTRDEVSSWFGDENAQHRRAQDMRDQGNGAYRGVGPKGYHRSDERIKDDINDRLSDDPYVDASDIEVLVENGEVTLSGRVMSKAIKRRAEDIADSVSAVTNVENRIRISPFSKEGQQEEEREAQSVSGIQRQSRQKS